MIVVDDRDRDVLCFLWVDDIAKSEPEIKAYRFTWVVFGVSSSPFLLNVTIRFHLESHMESNGEIVKCLRSTYVDDIVSEADTGAEAFKLFVQAKVIFKRGGFNLRKFVTNSPELQSCWGSVPTSDSSDETYTQVILGAQDANQI